MPKVRRSKPKVYVDNSIAAKGALIFSIGTQLVYFGNGGYSFVLEDRKGKRVRFAYKSISAAESPIGAAQMRGFFSADDDLQPRYLDNDVNQPYIGWQEIDFFGYGYEEPGSDVRHFHNETGAAVRVYAGATSAQFSTGTLTEVMGYVESLVNNTIRAINYVNELDITAAKRTVSATELINGRKYEILNAGDTDFTLLGAADSNPGTAFIASRNGTSDDGSGTVLASFSIQLTQDVGGARGNTSIFRGFGTGVNSEGSEYDILTNDIQTINFSGGVDIINLEYHKKSGNLSNAIKKSLDEKSFEIGTLPINQKITGKKLNNINFAFDDSTVFEFTQQKINPRLGIPYYPLSYLLAENPEVEINDGVIVQNKSFRNSTEWADQFAHFNTDEYPQRKVSNTSIFSYPNKFSDFVLSHVNLKDSELKSKNLDIFLEKQNIYEDYEPYSEVDKLIEFNDSSWQSTNVNNNSYHIKNSKQIKLNIDFEQSANALLIDTANTKVEDNYLELDNQTVTRYAQNTAYWNFNNNRWEYLNVLEKYPGDDGFYNSGNYSNILPIPSELAVTYTIVNSTVDTLLSIDRLVSDHSNIRNYITSPSFRGTRYGNSNNNTTNFMQTSNSCGFPNGYKWNPSNDQLLKMSDYITSDFMLEKILIRFNAKASLKINPDSMAAVKGYNESQAFHGLSFFFARQNQDFEGKNNIKISDINYYLEGDSERLQYIDTFYPQQVTNLFSIDTLTTEHRPNPYFDGHQAGNWKTYQLATKANYYQIPAEISQADSILSDYVDLVSNITWDGKTNNEIDILGANESKFYYINSGSEDESGISNQDMQIKLTSNASRYTSNDYDNIYSINPINALPSSEFAYRDIITLSNVMFVGSNVHEEDLYRIENDLNIDKVVNRSNEAQDILLELNLKRSENEFYCDESFYFNTTDSSNTTILEGKCEKQTNSRIFNSKNIANAINRDFEQVGQVILAENQKNIINTYNYLLKPSDKLIFGISSYGNGNDISTMVQLYDNIEITFIGKEVHDIKNDDSSKSIRKVITPKIETRTNNDAYTNLRENKRQKAFTKGFKEKLISQQKLVKNVILDTSMPNFIDYLDLIDKKFNNFSALFSFGGDSDPSDDFTFLEGNLLLTNRFDSSIDLQETTKEKHLFYDNVYNDYVFEKFKEGSAKRSDFTDYRLLSSSLINSLNTNISFLNILDSSGTTVSYDLNQVRKFNYSIRYDQVGYRETSDYKNLFDNPVPLKRIEGSASNITNYGMPISNATTSAIPSTLVQTNSGASGSAAGYMIKPSDYNYKIKHSIPEDDDGVYEAQISIQRNKNHKFYLVLHNTLQSVSNLITQLKSDPNFALHVINRSPSELSYQQSLRGTVSRHSFPLTIRSLTKYNDPDNGILWDDDQVPTTVGGLDISNIIPRGFTKEFIYIKNENDQEFLITELDWFEMGDKIVDYFDQDSLPVSQVYVSANPSLQRKYEIAEPGNTDFTDLGASSNTSGTVFFPTRDGTAEDGSGTVYDVTTNRNLVAEKYYTSDVNDESFIVRLVNKVIDRANLIESLYGATYYSGYPVDYFTGLVDFEERHVLGANDDNLMFAGMTGDITNGSTPTMAHSNNNFYENIIDEMRSTFTVKFYPTEYELKSNQSTPVYNNQTDDAQKRVTTNLDKRIKNYYHHFIDKKILQNDFLQRENVYKDANSNANNSASLINNEFIYSSPAYYVKNRDDSVLQATKTQYTFIFKNIDNYNNNISFSYLNILSIIDEKHFSSNFKPTYENTTLVLPDTGWLRIYEPNILKSFKDNFISNESLIPYYEIDLSDLSKRDNRTFEYTNDLNWLHVNLLSDTTRKFIINSSNQFNWSNQLLYQNLDREDENDRDPKIYAPWGEERIKDKNINDLVYIYGDNYNNFPFSGKKGYIYGVQASTSLEESTHFETYRYGQFSDHIKYTKNHATLESNINSINIKHTVEKKFYNSYFEVIDESELFNLTQSFNKNLHAQSNFPYIENKENELSQLNQNNTNYDAEYVF